MRGRYLAIMQRNRFSASDRRKRLILYLKVNRLLLLNLLLLQSTMVSLTNPELKRYCEQLCREDYGGKLCRCVSTHFSGRKRSPGLSEIGNTPRIEHSPTSKLYAMKKFRNQLSKALGDPADLVNSLATLSHDVNIHHNDIQHSSSLPTRKHSKPHSDRFVLSSEDLDEIHATSGNHKDRFSGNPRWHSKHKHWNIHQSARNGVPSDGKFGSIHRITRPAVPPLHLKRNDRIKPASGTHNPDLHSGHDL